MKVKLTFLQKTESGYIELIAVEDPTNALIATENSTTTLNDYYEYYYSIR
jgi:hypothetical protein